MTATLVSGRKSGTHSTDELVDLLRQALVKFQSGPEHLDDAWPKLTMQQLRVMRILYEEGPTRVSVLARRLNVSTPTVTGILDRLVNQGLTYRTDDPRDRRVVLNVLTPEGVNVIERLHPVQADLLEVAIQQLSEDEREGLCEGLFSLLSAISSLQ